MGHKSNLKLMRRKSRKAQADMFAEMYDKGPAVAEVPVNQEDDEDRYGMNYGSPPLFTGKNFENWFAEMKAFLYSENVWHLIENGFDDPCDEANDALALYFIHQALDDDLFHLVAAATTAREAWESLRMEFDVRGSNTNQHQAESLCVAVIEDVPSVRKVFDEKVEELLVETKENDDVLVYAGNHEHDEGKFHCIDISVDDESYVSFEQQLMQCLSEESEVAECKVGEIPTFESEIERCLMNVPESTKVFADILSSFAGISEDVCNQVEDVASRDVEGICSTEIATDIRKVIDTELLEAQEEHGYEILTCKSKEEGSCSIEIATGICKGIDMQLAAVEEEQRHEVFVSKADEVCNERVNEFESIPLYDEEELFDEELIQLKDEMKLIDDLLNARDGLHESKNVMDDELTVVAVKDDEDVSVCITEHDEFHCVETLMDINDVDVLTGIEDKEVVVVMDNVELVKVFNNLHAETIVNGEYDDVDEADDVIISEFLECLDSLSEVKSEFEVVGITDIAAVFEVESAIEIAEDMDVFINDKEIDYVRISHSYGSKHVPWEACVACEAIEVTIATHVDDEEIMRRKLMRITIFLNNWDVFVCAGIPVMMECSNVSVTNDEVQAVVEVKQHVAHTCSDESCRHKEPEETLKMEPKLRMKKMEKFSQHSVKTKMKKKVRRIPEFKVWSRRKKKWLE